MKNLLIATFTIFILSLSAFSQEKTNHKIDEIQAFLIYEENGKLSKNILDGKFTFWNTVIGEGDAEGHSSATLVQVIISTNGKTEKVFPQLQFSAISENGKTVNYTKTVDYFFPKEGVSKVYVPFLLHDTGCQKIKMTVKLVSNKSKTAYQTVTKVIPFVCGE